MPSSTSYHHPFVHIVTTMIVIGSVTFSRQSAFEGADKVSSTAATVAAEIPTTIPAEDEKNRTDALSPAPSDSNAGNGSSSYSSAALMNEPVETFLQNTRIARRVQYINQQLTNTLKIRNANSNARTLTNLPNVLVEKLLPMAATSQTEYYVSDDPERTRRRQVVLFSEEETVNCIPGPDDVLCLKFKMSDDLLMTEIISAIIWVNKYQLGITSDQIHSVFSIYEMFQWNVRQPFNKTYNAQKIFEKDGWYQIEIGDIIKGWQMHKQLKQRTIIIHCDICNPSSRSTVTYNESNNNDNGNITKTTVKADSDSLVPKTSSTQEESNINTISNPLNCTLDYASPAITDSSDSSSTNADNKQNSAFLLLSIEPEKNNRWKRGIDCVPDHQEECCREDLFVNFSELNDQYKMIYYPQKFNAYICKGKCQSHSFTGVGLPYSSAMAHVRIKNPIPIPCCTPTKFSSLQVFYSSDKSTVEQAFISNIIVEGCGCV